MTNQWFEELKQTDPKLAEAHRVVGAGHSRDALLSMIRVLQLSRLNTPEDDRRLQAAQYIIGHPRGL